MIKDFEKKNSIQKIDKGLNEIISNNNTNNPQQINASHKSYNDYNYNNGIKNSSNINNIYNNDGKVEKLKKKQSNTSEGGRRNHTANEQEEAEKGISVNIHNTNFYNNIKIINDRGDKVITKDSPMEKKSTLSKTDSLHRKRSSLNKEELNKNIELIKSHLKETEKILNNNPLGKRDDNEKAKQGISGLL